MATKAELLQALLDGETVDFEPKTKNQAYLKACCERCGCEGLPKPTTINGALLYQLAEKMAGGGSVERITWHQCPQDVIDYIESVTYDPNDYSTSQIASYAPSTAVESNTKPIGKTVDGVTYYNEIPNVETPFASTNAAGTIKPLDRIRWINMQTENVRDLGGWSCDGGTIKYGILFRGGEPEAEDVEIADALHIGYELNLRGSDAPIRDYSVWGVHYSQFDDFDWYVGTKPELWKKLLGVVFDCVLHKVPLFFHCKKGADRTGAMALVIETLLGVSQSDCDKDYELTCFSTGTGTDADARRRNETAWRTSINFVNSQYGTTFRNKMINWVASLGFSEDDINLFRQMAIDGNPEHVTPEQPQPTPTTTNVFEVSGTYTFNANTPAQINQWYPRPNGKRLFAKWDSLEYSGTDASEEKIGFVLVAEESVSRAENYLDYSEETELLDHYNPGHNIGENTSGQIRVSLQKSSSTTAQLPVTYKVTNFRIYYYND